MAMVKERMNNNGYGLNYRNVTNKDYYFKKTCQSLKYDLLMISKFYQNMDLVSVLNQACNLAYDNNLAQPRARFNFKRKSIEVYNQINHKFQVYHEYSVD